MDLTPYDDPEDAVSVAFRLTRRRLRLNQRELAEVLGWDPSAVGRWESGHVLKALGRVDGVLRGMGFRLAVVVVDPAEWADVDEPLEHLVDRGFRRLPAHLDPEVERHPPLHWWLRYRDKPNPLAPNWTYRMRPQDRRTVLQRQVGEGGAGDEAEVECASVGEGEGDESAAEGEGASETEEAKSPSAETTENRPSPASAAPPEASGSGRRRVVARLDTAVLGCSSARVWGALLCW